MDSCFSERRRSAEKGTQLSHEVHDTKKNITKNVTYWYEASNRLFRPDTYLMYCELSFTSRIARHGYLLWTADHHDGDQVTVPGIQKSLVLNMPLSSFNQNMAPLKYGRFYPARVLRTSAQPPAGIFRVTGISSTDFTADFNHPLAGKDITLQTVSLPGEWPAVGRPPELLEWAGIDAPLDEQDTDFSAPHSFDREDPSDDAIFYENPRKVIHTDQTCLSRITALYRDLIRPEDSVLDLMSSWRSHLPDRVRTATGLGMNAAEMADNPRLNTYIVHDLNRSPRLPFEDRSFHVVVNTVSIEYLTEPRQVFSDVMRVLRPGGRVIVTFSNRYFPPKTTMLWTQLHPAERLGWVLQVLHTAGFSGLHCRVERGLRRSQDDRYTGQIEEMDPLFAAWGKADTTEL